MRERKKEDLRVLKTRKKLEDALLELLGDSDITTIKVSDLCERAGISRATFYNNFNSVEDIFRAYLTDISKPLKEDILKITKEDTTSEEVELVFWQFIHVTIKGLYQNKENFSKIFKREEEAQTGLFLLSNFLKNMLTEVLTPFKAQIERNVPFEIYIAGLAGLIPSALFTLFTSDKNYTLGQMERYLYHMVVEVYVDYQENHFSDNK